MRITDKQFYFLSVVMGIMFKGIITLPLVPLHCGPYRILQIYPNIITEFNGKYAHKV